MSILAIEKELSPVPASRTSVLMAVKIQERRVLTRKLRRIGDEFVDLGLYAHRPYAIEFNHRILSGGTRHSQEIAAGACS